MEGEVNRTGDFIEFNGDICAQTEEQLLKEVKGALQDGAKRVTLLICSEGGVGEVAFRMVRRIKELLQLYAYDGRPVPLWTYGVGDIASAAVVLFSAGDRRCISKNAQVKFHEVMLAFRPTVGGIPAKEIRDAITQVRAGGCFCRNETIAILLNEIAKSDLMYEFENMSMVQECRSILKILEKGGHCCEKTTDIVNFLESIVAVAGKNASTYASIIAKRSGLAASMILLFMAKERNFESPLAVAIGLADEEV